MGTNTLYSLNILKQLKESGIIEITKAHIVIKNFEKYWKKNVSRQDKQRNREKS
ncbi:hypothetical protein KQI61_18020 [Anaerocolumna aminovalerica]|uniref:hypothetical protein n=1 Tax=Anaerocolumna aminovalerica TaxID=1527 RepID=UPI001C0EAF50|nr:hypothetical protein [Anaerocolumna aminovalerica]MBU5334093.1 hypothetical protein [Anaerocolumna aminovalerica]